MESAEKRPVRVTIANQSFTVMTSGDDREVIELAQQVDELISSLAARSANIDASRLAILACLHLADRLHSIEREMKTLKDRVDERGRHLGGLLDQIVE